MGVVGTMLAAASTRGALLSSGSSRRHDVCMMHMMNAYVAVWPECFASISFSVHHHRWSLAAHRAVLSKNIFNCSTPNSVITCDNVCYNICCTLQSNAVVKIIKRNVTSLVAQLNQCSCCLFPETKQWLHLQMTQIRGT